MHGQKNIKSAVVQQFSNELFPCGHPTSGTAFTSIPSVGWQNSSTVKAFPVHIMWA